MKVCATCGIEGQVIVVQELAQWRHGRRQKDECLLCASNGLMKHCQNHNSLSLL
jgi:hypothetical protein